MLDIYILSQPQQNRESTKLISSICINVTFKVSRYFTANRNAVFQHDTATVYLQSTISDRNTILLTTPHLYLLCSSTDYDLKADKAHIKHTPVFMWLVKPHKSTFKWVKLVLLLQTATLKYSNNYEVVVKQCEADRAYRPFTFLSSFLLCSWVFHSTT